MSKYLKSGKTTRYTSRDQSSYSAYTRATRIFGIENNNTDATDSAAEFPHSVQSGNAVNYTEHDQQQFSAMEDFPAGVNTCKKTDHGTWKSCQFTDQDDAGFRQLQYELSAVADSKR